VVCPLRISWGLKCILKCILSGQTTQGIPEWFLFVFFFPSKLKADGFLCVLVQRTLREG